MQYWFVRVLEFKATELSGAHSHDHDILRYWSQMWDQIAPVQVRVTLEDLLWFLRPNITWRRVVYKYKLNYNVLGELVTGTTTRLRNWRSGVRLPLRHDILSSPKRPDRLYNPLSLLFNGYRVFLSWGVKRLGPPSCRLRMSETITLISHTTSWRGLGKRYGIIEHQKPTHNTGRIKQNFKFRCSKHNLGGTLWQTQYESQSTDARYAGFCMIIYWCSLWSRVLVTVNTMSFCFMRNANSAHFGCTFPRPKKSIIQNFALVIMSNCVFREISRLHKCVF